MGVRSGPRKRREVSPWLHPSLKTREFLDLLTETNILSLSSAVAYYTVLSLTPFLLLTFAALGAIGWRSFPEFQQGVIEALGPNAVIVLQGVQDRLQGDEGGLAFGIFGGVTLLFSATLVISELQNALNILFLRDHRREEADDPDRASWALWLETKALAVLALLFCIFIATVSFVISVAIRLLLPLEDEVFWTLMRQLFSFVVFSILFCFMFRYLPRRRQPWVFSWKAGMLCSVLFHLGKAALEVYFSVSVVKSSYGAMSSFIVLLLWAYYNGLIILVSAAFAHAFFRGRDGSAPISTAT